MWMVKGQQIGRMGSYRWNTRTLLSRASRECYRIFDINLDVNPVPFEAFKDRIHPDDFPALEQALVEAVSTKSPFSHEYRVVHRDGTTLRVIAEGEFDLGPTGDVELEGIITDITARTAAEQALTDPRAGKCRPQNRCKNWPLKPPVGRAPPLRLRMRPSRPDTGNRSSKTLAPARPGSRFASDVFRKFSATYCASPAAAASGPWKSRPPMQSDCMAATRSGRTSRSGCSTTPASSAPAGMKKTGAGRRSRRRSPLRICRSDFFAAEAWYKSPNYQKNNRLKT
jgi:PAS fold